MVRQEKKPHPTLNGFANLSQVQWQKLKCVQGGLDLILATSGPSRNQCRLFCPLLLLSPLKQNRGLSPSQISIWGTPQICLPVRLINTTKVRRQQWKKSGFGSWITDRNIHQRKNKQLQTAVLGTRPKSVEGCEKGKAIAPKVLLGCLSPPYTFTRRSVQTYASGLVGKWEASFLDWCAGFWNTSFIPKNWYRLWVSRSWYSCCRTANLWIWDVCQNYLTQHSSLWN